jgi:hypothetical protein
MFIYYVDGEKFTSDNFHEIPWGEISSPDEQTPAYEDLLNGYRSWVKKGGDFHRLTGPARTWIEGDVQFWLNGIDYINVYDWLKEHPNKSEAFHVEMLLKYT